MSTTEDDKKTFTCRSCKTDNLLENAMLLHWCSVEVSEAEAEAEAVVNLEKVEMDLVLVVLKTIFKFYLVC